MKLYSVQYTPNSYDAPKEVLIVAATVVKAATEVLKKQYSGYNKTVISVTQQHPTVYVAK